MMPTNEQFLEILGGDIPIPTLERLRSLLDFSQMANSEPDKLSIELIHQGKVWVAKCGEKAATGVSALDAIKGVTNVIILP